jgi:PAS domain S-box-containing protein
MKDYRISELLDLSTIQKLAEAHYQVCGMPIGIIDASDGLVLVATGWQDICTLFHRAHPSSLKYCQESDNYIKSHLFEGEACHYHCKNGLWDIGIPIMVAKRHLATIFLGQFFYEGENPDRDYFIRQAQGYGYNLSEYLAALDRVPVFSKEKVDNIIAYNKSFSRFMAELADRSLSNFEAEQALRDSEYKFRVLTETSPAAIFLYQKEKIVYANPATARMLGFAEEELQEMSLWDWIPSELKDMVQNEGLTRQLGGSVLSPFECKFTSKGGEERWGYISTGRIEYQGNPAGIVIINDITKKKEMKEGLRNSTEKYQAVVETFDGLIYICSDDYRIEFMNEKLINRTGKDAVGEFCYKALHDRDSVCPWCVNERVFAGETVRWELQSPKDGRWYYVVNAPIHNADGSMSKQSMIMDITERRVAEEERNITIEFLSLVNACTGTQDLFSAAATFFQQRSGCEAVGIRLREGNAYPYVEARGFLPELIRVENELCLRDDEGNIFRDNDGNPVIECMCGNVICGLFDPSKPFFTKRGSFWANSTTELLAGFTETDRQFLTRNRCNGEGYESVALIPLHAGQERLGLLQLNDRRKGLFSAEAIELWERLAGYLAVALAKCRSEDALRKAQEELRRSHDELEKRVAERTEQLEKTVAALRSSEERYALAVQGSNDGIWDINLATGQIYFSPRWKSMLGYEDDEVPNDVEEWRKRIHQDDRHLVMESRKACLDGHIPAYEFEYRLQHKDGSFRWIHARGTCQRDLEGKPIRFSGSHSDITERKRIEVILRESEKKYRTLFEKSKDTIFISDAGRRFIDINQAGIELFGYTKEELFSLDLEKLYCNPEDRKVLWQKLSRSGFVSDFEVEMKRKDGVKIIVHISFSVIKDDGGQVSGYQGIIRDMTERKRLERQLLQSQKMESVGILAGGVAHDFNNLLTAISGFGQIVQERIPEDDELSQESITNVLNAADRAAELTRGLLAFSRKQLISPKPLHIDTLIGNTGKLIQRIIGEDIEFSTRFSGEKLYVKADPGQIGQVLMNLATNARDAMPHGGHLSLATREVIVEEGTEKLYDLPSPGNYAQISVADTGTGIDKRTLENIFEPFYTTKEVGKGTGLGLAIVYGIIKQHNGSILANSEPNKGTIFNIYLPLIKSHADKEKSKISTPPAGGMETLLLVEDEEIVKMFVKNILERAGYKVIIADNGEDAVARFREHDDISLVLSDVVMPRKTGKEMHDEIRRIKPDVKVIFISGYSADVMQKKGMFEENTEFITKPFKKNDLLQKVREVLDRV